MAVRVNQALCEGCMNCSHTRLRGILSWSCCQAGESWKLDVGEVAPIWCPVYKAQVEVPLVEVTERWDQYHFVNRAVMRATTWDVRVRMIPACDRSRPEERLRGLRASKSGTITS